MSNELVQAGFFDLGEVRREPDEITIIADWNGLSEEEIEQEASRYHDELDRRERQLEAIKIFVEEQQKNVIYEKGELYRYMKATKTYDKWIEWLKIKNVSYRAAQEYIQMATEYRNELTCTSGASKLSRNQIRAIHRTGEGHEILAKVNSGDINPTWEALNKEIEAANQRAREAEERLEAERKAHSLFKEDVEFREKTKEQTYVALKQKVTELENKPAPEPQKVTVYEDTPEAKAKISSLKAKTTSLEEQIGRMQGRLVDLARESKKYEEMFQQTREANSKYVEENKKLSEEAKRRWIEGQIELDQLRVRQEWRKAVEKYLEDTAGFIARVPALINREAFESDDWSRYEQCVHVTEQSLNLLKNVQSTQSSQFVDASVIDSSVSLIPMNYIEG